MIHWELYQKLKFYHTNQWYMHNPTSVLKKDTHKLLWDFEIQTGHLISATWPDLKIINKRKRTYKIDGLCCPGWPLSKIKRKRKKDKYLDLTRELKKMWNMKVTFILYYYYWYSWYSHQRIYKGTRGLGNTWTGQNTKKSLGDLRRLAITQTPVRKHQLTFTRKTLKGV